MKLLWRFVTGEDLYSSPWLDLVIWDNASQTNGTLIFNRQFVVRNVKLEILVNGRDKTLGIPRKVKRWKNKT